MGWWGGGGSVSNATYPGAGPGGGGTSYLNNTSYGVILVSNLSVNYYTSPNIDSDAPNAGSGNTAGTSPLSAYDGAVIVTFYSSTAGGLQTTALTVSGSVQATEYVTSTQLTPVLNTGGYTSPLFTPSSAGASVGYYVATSYSLTPGNQLVVAPFAVTYDGSMVPSTGTNITPTTTTNAAFFYNVSGNTLVLANGTGAPLSNIYTRITKLG